MTAITSSITLKTRTAYPDIMYGAIAIDATADTALAAITTSSTVADVLDIINACIARNRVTTSTTTGLATGVQLSTAPTDITLSAAALAASTAGNVTPVTIGTLAAVQPTATPVTFTLVAGTGDTDNADYQITGTTLEYIGTGESAGTNTVRVRVTNSVGQTYEEAFTITVS